MTKGQETWKQRGQRWLPWVILGLFWVAKTAAIWRHLQTRHYAIRGPLLDTLNMLWLSWWTEFSVASSNHTLLFSDLINFPLGGSSAVDYSLAFLHVGVAGLLRGVLPDLVAHNVMALAGFSFSLVAIFLLLREAAGEGVLAALFACLVTTFGLATANQLPDLELLWFGYLPLALVGWLRFIETGRVGWGVGAVLLTGLTAYAQMYYGLALILMLSGVALALLGQIPLVTGGPRRDFQRTLWVLGGGFGLALLLHARNIYNAVSARTIVTPEFTAAVPWPFDLTDGLLLLLVCVAPIWLGLWLGARRVALWGMLALPPTLLSLGYGLTSDWTGVVPMPLSWLREVVPFVWRITFPNRFVAPLLLALAASLMAAWRMVPALLPETRARWRPAMGAVLLLGFWVAATFVPLVPSDCAPLMNMASGTAGERLASYPPPGMPVAALTHLDADGQCAGVRNARLPRRALFWPWQPLETVAMPPLPPCLADIAADPQARAILELSRCDVRGYVGYFHTAHKKAIAGYPCRQYGLAARYDAPSKLSRFQAAYSQDGANRLLTRDELQELGVDYVVRYEIPGCILMGRSGADSTAPPSRWSEADLVAAYGEVTCRDPVTRVHRLGQSGGH